MESKTEYSPEAFACGSDEDGEKGNEETAVVAGKSDSASTDLIRSQNAIRWRVSGKIPFRSSSLSKNRGGHRNLLCYP